MEEAVSGVKGELATKIYGDDLHTLEDKADQMAAVMSQRARASPTSVVLQVTGQPDLNFDRGPRQGRAMADQRR